MNAPFKKLEKQIEQGRIARVYLAVGEEYYGKSRFLAALKQKLVDPSMIDFNFDQLSADEATGAEIADKAAVMPMMASQRLIIVQQCQNWSAKDLNVILKYVEDPFDTTCLVLEFAAQKGKKLFQVKNPHVQVLDFAKPKSWQLPDYIEEVGIDLGVSIHPDAIRLIAEMVGDDLPKIHRELDKLSLFKLNAGPIQVDDVEKLLGRTRQATRWELNDYIGSRDLSGALTKAHEILGGSEEPLGLLMAISGFIKQLFSVKMLMGKGMKDKTTIGRQIGLFYPSLVEKLMQQQANFSNAELRDAFRLLQETDSKLKGSGLNKALLIDRLLCGLVPCSNYTPPRTKAQLQSTTRR